MEVNQSELKQILKESGLSQSKLAQKLGISRQHLHDILKLNRKSKYSDQIFDLLKQGGVHSAALNTHKFRLKENYRIESLPLIVLDDLIRIYRGEASSTMLTKPFYAKYPFINYTDNENDFCLRLNDIFDDNFYIAIGAFRFSLSLDFKKGEIVLLYLSDSQKILAGKININPDTKEKFIVNNNSMYTLRTHDILMAECTQIVQTLF